MTKASTFMDGFMKKLQSDSFIKDNQPNKGPEVNAEFVAAQLSSYRELLKSGIVETTTCN